MDSDLADIALVFGEDEDEMRFNSAILRLSSPVFNAMLTGDMCESTKKRAKVEVSGKEEFKQFYELLLPVTSRKANVTEKTLDATLVLCDYYQVGAIKDECEAFLKTLPVTVPRLFQARKHGLSEQYERCAKEIASTFSAQDLELFKSDIGCAHGCACQGSEKCSKARTGLEAQYCDFGGQASILA
jgi:hypothetical protein